MIMTNGIGATIGTLSAQAVINRVVYSQPEGVAQATGWSHAWLIFAAYAFVVAVLFFLIFKNPKKEETKHQLTEAEAAASETDAI